MTHLRLRLLLDSCTEHGVVVFFERGQIKFSGIIPEGVHNSTLMMVEIEKGCRLLGIRPADLEFIAVTVGPGSYTGVRVGVVIAKTLAYAAKVPLIPLSSLNGYVPEEDGPFASVIDARIGGVYLRLGCKKGREVEWTTAPELCDLEALEGSLQTVRTLVTPKATQIQKKINHLYPHLALQWIESPPNTQQMIHEAESRFLAGEGCEASKIEIAYLRKTQAEIERDLTRP